MQIDIDFDVFKALTALRESEDDSYNAVVRRLLNLSPESLKTEEVGTADDLLHGVRREPVNILQLLAALPPTTLTSRHGNFLNSLAAGGAWFNNIHFPEGTLFRATYKGETYSGKIRNGRWVDQDGNKRTSPSDAASAISGTNVNGWKFWYTKRPTDEDWVRLDDLKP